MASGSSVHANTGSKGFDFATDDILCSYEDCGNQDSSNGSNSDPAVGTNSSKDLNKSRLSRPAMYATYSQPEDSVNQDMSSVVDRSMKKHAENIMRFLEGISSRLSQLELYCYNLDKSIGEMRCEFTRDHGDADIKLKALDKHIQEVHRSVQILRDKQELADTQKELAKLQLAQKETSPRGSQSSEDKSSAPADARKTDNASNQQLALALPHQVSLPASQGPPQNLPQQQTYYLQPTQIPNQSSTTHIPQIQYIVADPQGRTSQMQDISRVAQPPVNQTPNMSPYPQYQQQWSQQMSQPVQPPPHQQQSSLPPQMKNPSPPVYAPYPSGQATTQDTLSSSMPMQMQYSGVQSPVTSHADSIPYGYSVPGRIVQQQPPSQQQQVKVAFGPQRGDGGYSAPPSSGYVVYEAERGRPQPHHPPQQGHFSQGVYPPPNGPFQNPQSNPPSNLPRNNTNHPQFVRSNPYSELIDKMVNMGFRGDHVVAVIQRIEETGQPVDFNGVLDRLNGGHHPVSSQRGWSG